MSAERGRRLRCAIYTRKSSEEGLDQAFNSLDAQREACEAYIRSQAGEGWHLIRTHYDDGGISGGTLDRPALQQLLADIRTRKVDTVVVYKVDRLTRSLSDFAKIVEVFDAHGVSFVSVTQQFNTTTSMGRLTLNMLLSFAQFEREVTSERIRDKIAASKKKGMWMGGFVPLGYEARDRSLVINEAEAETVRAVFQLYLEHGNVRQVKEEADRRGLKTKLRPAEDGRMRGGRPLSRGYIYKLLGNPIYAGRIAHKDETYDGQHEAIIESETWEAVQAKLAGHTIDRRSGTHAAEPSLLAGLLYDDRGNRLSPSHAVKNGARYRYYVSQAVLQYQDEGTGTTIRIPAREIEALVGGAIRTLLKNPARVIDELSTPTTSVRDQRRLLTACERWIKRWPGLSPSGYWAVVRTVVRRVEIRQDEIELTLSRRCLRRTLLEVHQRTKCQDGQADDCPLDHDGDALTLRLTTKLRRCSGELRLVVPPHGGPDLEPRPDAALTKALTRAYAWKQQLLSGEFKSIRAVARREGLAESYVRRILPLAFLAPDITEAILEGCQPADLELDRLLKGIPLAWDEQRQVFGFTRLR